MNDFNQFKDKVNELVRVWKTVIKPGIEESGQYGETNTRKYLIDPILDALNWIDGGSKKIVDNEFAVKHKTGTGSADYALKVNGIPKILVEAKDIAKVNDLENGYDTVHGIKRTYPRQLSNYCHDLNTQGFDINFTILTNGKEWIIYNMQYADISSEREIVFRLDLEEIDKQDNLKKLWSLELNQFIDGHRLRELIQQLHDYRLDIDKKAVQQLLECKDLLSSSIFEDYEKDKRGIKKQIDAVLKDTEKTNGMPTFQEIPEEERLSFFIKEASSNLINKILFIRILEDKNFLTPKLTKRSVEKWKDFMGYRDYEEIMKLFRDACGVTEKLYNGGLFKLNPYDQIEYDPNIIKKIIDILGEIDFKGIDSDIIGRIYEIYLGQVLKVEAEIRGKKRTKYQADNQERKKLGQYYTPKFVVDFIVKNTLGKLIEGKKPEEIAKLRILDPACGSGSFLINAYDHLVEYYENWNSLVLKKIEEDNKKNGASLGRYQNNEAIPNYKNIILKDNIHGVDLNDLSVQIAEINLWLRALERDKKLIKLNKNILHGNSLISGVEDEEELNKYKKELEEIKARTHEIKDYYDKDVLSRDEIKKLEKLEEELKELKNRVNPELNLNLKTYFGDHLDTVHPFNWEVEFPEVMQEGGFDVVIGNPPYIRVQTSNSAEKDYLCQEYLGARGKYDIYVLFIEKALKLVKEGGLFSFIVPNKFTQAKYGELLKEHILKKYTIEYFIDFGDLKVFEEVTTYPCIIVIKKEKPSKKFGNYFKIKKLSPEILHKASQEVGEKYCNNEDYTYFNFRQQTLTKDNWSFMPEEMQMVYDKIIKSSEIKLGEITEKNIQGFITGDNESFMFKVDNVPNIEPNLLKKVPKGKNVQKYVILDDGYQVLYTNKSDKSPLSISDLKKYPKVLNYLNEKSIQLKKRKFFGKEMSEFVEWWQLVHPLKFEYFETPKIITPNLSSENRFVFDEEGYFIEHDCYIITLKNKYIPDYKYIVALLNSKVIEFFFKQTSPMFSGGYYKYHTQYLDKIPIVTPNKEFKQKIVENVNKITNLKKHQISISKELLKSFSNQPIKDPKFCIFSHYFDNYELYGMERETFGRINQIKAKIHSLDVKEEWDKLIIDITTSNEEQNQLDESIKAVKLTIKDEDVRKFLFFALKKYINDKGGRGFGSGNILELIKDLEVPVYVANVKMNIDKIKDVMKEFNHNSKDLWWRDESKKEKFKSLNELEAEIKKTDIEIDEMVYTIYGVTEEEKKIIEESLK